MFICFCSSLQSIFLLFLIYLARAFFPVFRFLFLRYRILLLELRLLVVVCH